jgi:hypothetical protein
MPSICRTLQTSNGRKKNHTLKEQEKGGQKPEAILTEEENRVLLKTNPDASSALYDACSWDLENRRTAVIAIAIFSSRRRRSGVYLEQCELCTRSQISLRLLRLSVEVLITSLSSARCCSGQETPRNKNTKGDPQRRKLNTHERTKSKRPIFKSKLFRKTRVLA